MCSCVCGNVCACDFVYVIVYTHVVCGSGHGNKNEWTGWTHTHV